MLRKISKIFRRQQSDSPPGFYPPTFGSDNQNLFGRPLSETTSDKTTCEPHQQVMAIMSYLCELGPSTSEIFRKPANSKKISQLVHRIENNDTTWVSDPDINGLIVASVFKRYLREIPGKLLNNKNYKRWSYITENITKRETKISAIKRMISDLDEVRTVLLRYVISLLVRIQEYSSINLMTTYNLSVCIGPCLLWTNSSNRTDIERTSIIVPKLVEFILENHEAIFGDEVKRLLSTAQLGKGASLSLDSVLMPDNQLFYQMTRKSRAPTNMHRGSLASRDSGLILYGDESTENLVDRVIMETVETSNNNVQEASSMKLDVDNTKKEAESTTEPDQIAKTNNPKRYIVRLTTPPYTIIEGDKLKSDYLYTTTVQLPIADIRDYIPTEYDNSKQYKSAEHVFPARHHSQKAPCRVPRLLTRQRPRTVYYV